MIVQGGLGGFVGSPFWKDEDRWKERQSSGETV